MKKILITLILTFQISFSFSQDYTIDVTAKSKNDYKISGEDLNGKIEGLDIDLNFAVGNKIVFKVPDGANKKNLKKNIEKIFKVNVTKINIINKQNRTKVTRGRKVKVSGYKKAIITLKKGQSIDLTTGI